MESSAGGKSGPIRGAGGAQKKQAETRGRQLVEALGPDEESKPMGIKRGGPDAGIKRGVTPCRGENQQPAGIPNAHTFPFFSLLGGIIGNQSQ